LFTKSAVFFTLMCKNQQQCVITNKSLSAELHCITSPSRAVFILSWCHYVLRYSRRWCSSDKMTSATAELSAK